MKPKEKAKELVDKFYHNDIAKITSDEQAMEDAKQCALICVGEIMKEQFYGTDGYYKRTEYWQEVETEIKKL